MELDVTKQLMVHKSHCQVSEHIPWDYIFEEEDWRGIESEAQV